MTQDSPQCWMGRSHPACPGRFGAPRIFLFLGRALLTGASQPKLMCKEPCCSLESQKLSGMGLPQLVWAICSKKQPKVRAQTEAKFRAGTEWLEAPTAASHSCCKNHQCYCVAPAIILSNQLWKKSNIHSSFLIWVQLVLSLPVAKEMLHLGKQLTISLTTEQTMPSCCYAC